MPKNIRGLNIRKAANGHSVQTDIESSPGGKYEPPPPPHVFGANDHKAMMAHIGGQLGLDDDNDAGSEPDNDADDAKIAAHNKKARVKANPGKAKALFAAMRARNAARTKAKAAAPPVKM